MTRKWVVNASPLIILGKLSQIELLTELADTLVIPEAVAQEIERGATNDPARLWLTKEGPSFIKKVPPIANTIANWDLGDGESHVLSWAATNKDYEAILDDLAARRCAQTLSIPVRGTLGIMLLAKKSGMIPDIEPLLNALVASGFRVDPNILDAIRELVGE